MRWPIGIALFLGTVVLVNGAFIYIAYSGADEVDPAWYDEQNRK